MSGKRQGDNLHQDNWEDDSGGGDEQGTWRKADEETMRARKVRRAKRPVPSSGILLADGSAPATLSSNPFANVQLVAPSPAALAGGAFSFSATAPALAPAAAAPAFAFGAFGSTAAPAPAPIPAMTGPAPTFNFGGPAVPASAGGAAFTFGGSVAVASSASTAPAAAPVFTFGSGTPSTAAAADAPTQPKSAVVAAGAPVPANVPGAGGGCFSFGAPTTDKASPFGAPFGGGGTSDSGMKFSAPPPSFTFGQTASGSGMGGSLSGPAAFGPGASSPAKDAGGALTGVFSFGATAVPPAAPPPSTSARATTTMNGNGVGAFAFGTAAATAGSSPGTSLPPGAAAAPAAAGAVVGPEIKKQLEQLNADLTAWLQEELQMGGEAADWSDGLLDYLKQRKAILASLGAPVTKPPSLFGSPPAAAPLFGSAPAAPLFGSAPAAPLFGSAPAAPLFGSAPAAPLFGSAPAAPLFGSAPAAPLFGSAPVAAPAALAPAAPSAALSSDGGAAAEPSGGETSGADEVWKTSCKLSVYRTEKKNEEGELIQEKGWKPVGKGLLKLLKQDGVAFLEFRPLISESSSAGNDPEDEVSAKSERYGRAVVSARLLPDTTFQVAKKTVLTNLWSNNASGQPTYSRYSIPLGSEEKAAEFAAVASKSAAQVAAS